MKISECLYSLTIYPKNGSKDNPAVTISYFSSGLFVFAESEAFCLNDKIRLNGAFSVNDLEHKKAIESFIKEGRNVLSKAPTDLKMPAKGPCSEYFLSFGNALYHGNLIFTDKNILDNLTGKDYELAAWNNVVVKFTERLGNFTTNKEIDGSLVTTTSYLTFIKNPSRFLLSKACEFLGSSYHATNLDMALKKAIKIAYENKSLPDGASYSYLFNLYRMEGLKLLTLPKKLFEKEYAYLVSGAMTILHNSTFADCAYILDLYFLMALLMQNVIIDEKSIALLHAPISPMELKDRYGGLGKTAYYKYVSYMNKKDKNSPIYNFLLGILGAREESEISDRIQIRSA